MLQNLTNDFLMGMNEFIAMLDVSTPSRVLILIVDITIVSLLCIYVYRLIKKTRASNIFKGVFFLIMLSVVAKAFNMVILDFILTNFMTYGILLIIVVFQPELRNVFERIGRRRIVDVFDMDENIYVKHSISEIVKAVERLSLKQIGALIVLERQTKISDVLKEGINIDSNVSSELIQNIFMPRTPLHDGAIIINKNKILSAKCILPLASEVTVPKSLGTRHRAAAGITEISDAIVIVVSEETGIISLVESGNFIRELNGDELKSLLLKKMDRTRNANVIKTIVKK